MTDNSEEMPVPQGPQMIQIDPRVALEEQVALAEFYRNRNLLNAQAAFAERQKNAELGEAINMVQEQTNQVVADNETMRGELDALKAKSVKAKTVN